MGSKRKAERARQNAGSHLPRVEILMYSCVTVLAVSYICYSVFRDSKKYDGILNLYDFGPGWSFIGKDQDISNFEWHFWYNWFWKIWPWYLGQMAIGKIFERKFIQWRQTAFLVYAVVCLCTLVGWRSVVLYTMHTVAPYCITGTGSPMAVWVVSLSMLSTLNFEPFISFMKSLVEDDEEERWYYLLMFTVALVNIRSTSFSLEKCLQTRSEPVTPGDADPQQQDPNTNQTQDVTNTNQESATSQEGQVVGENDTVCLKFGLLDLLCYSFYLPLFFTGPIITYNLFKHQMTSPVPPWTRTRVVYLGLNMLRFIFWGFFNEFILHFFYFNSLQQNMTVLQSVSLWTLAGIGYCQGQFFMNKYLVMFGFPASVARVDNLDPPPGPKCISYIYLYSDMWRLFDRGFYNFLKRYIYIACGGSRQGLFRQILGSVLCFAYIYFWHGAEYYIFLWILLNFAGVSLEALGRLLSELSFIKYLETSILSPAMVQRIHAVFAIPVFLISCFSIFCFFGGQVVGYIFFQRLIVEGWPVSWITLTVVLYCAIQNAIEVNRWQSRRQKFKQT